MERGLEPGDYIDNIIIEENDMVKRFDRHGKEGVLHYITLNVKGRCKAFKSAENARASCLTLRHHCDEYPAKLIAYIIMPEHIHAIVNPLDGDVSNFLTQLKPAITGKILDIAVEHQNQQVISWLYDEKKERNRLWQDGKYNFHLYTDRLIWQKINYIHTNPIARGITKTAEEYPFSSYRAMYGSNLEIIIPIDREMWWDEIVLEGIEK